MTGTLDVRKISVFIDAQKDLISEYAELQERYERIVRELIDGSGNSEGWKGLGADAFAEDAKIIKTNIVGLGDILTTMCSTLRDVREIFVECDSSLGAANRNVLKT